MPCATSRVNCLTPAVACPASTVAARSQIQETHTVTVKVATLGNSVMQSLSAEGNLCETSTRYSEATLSARQHAWSHGWSAPVHATRGPAALARE